MKKSTTKRTHVSPGIYFKEVEVPYSTKSLGITTLGLTGETLKGPAFQPISISDWEEFQSYFGGTSTEKFRGTQYPKYELPYIAQEYLKQSKQLEVVRTLGLSGVNAGPAWVITATKYEQYSSESEENPLEAIEFSADENETEGQEIEVDFTDSVSEKIGDNFIYSIGENTSGSGSGEIKKYIFGKPKDSLIPSDGEQKEGYSLISIDAHENFNCDVVSLENQLYISEIFDKLPMGIQKQFVDENGNPKPSDLYGKKDSWKKAFYYVGLDSELTESEIDDEWGKVCITYEYTVQEEGSGDGEPVEVRKSKVLFDGKINTASEKSHTDTDYTDIDIKKTVVDEHAYYYFILTRGKLMELLGIAGSGSGSGSGEDDDNIEFNASNFKVYQYGYNNIDDLQNPRVSETGKGYKYNATYHLNPIFEDKDSEYANTVIAVLRSRGEHRKSSPAGVDECGNTIYTYDGIEYYAKNVRLTPSDSLSLTDSCHPGYDKVSGDFTANAINYGRFNISVDSVKGCSDCGLVNYVTNTYSVSLNPTDKNYITKVLGTDPELGDKDIYVEELYDVALEQLILEQKINMINHEVAKFPYVSIVPSHEPVDDIMIINESDLTKRHLGKRYLYTYSESAQQQINVRISLDGGNTWGEPQLGIVGHIYTVRRSMNEETGKYQYFYGEYRSADGGILKGDKKFTEYLTLYQYYRDIESNGNVLNNCVKVKSDDCYYVYADRKTDNASDGDVIPVTLDFNNYREEYRYSSTPWIVSEIKGSGSEINLHRLFRFHTLSDGDNSVMEVKVSIENIDPEMEVFDVVVRSFNDSDVNPYVLERFNKCSLKPGESNYISLKIGDIEGNYVSNSAYITVEVNEDDVTSESIPCGFLGYPVRNYSGFGVYNLNEGETLSTSIKQPYVKFRTTIDEDMKIKKQYFGMSDLTGIDTDILSYKGVESYSENPEYLTPCFHLDSRILNGKPTKDDDTNWYVEEGDIRQFVSVDGIYGYTWATVSRTETTNAGIEPRIGSESLMEGTIYEDKNARKFTVCFYGGWDGWDYYRTSRSNGDEYRYNKYKGSINNVSGQGTMFNVITNPEAYGFDGDAAVINSDYYAYLAGVKQLDNPNTVKINLFATPGIDYVYQPLLVNDIVDIIEEERGDALYIITTPDKPAGAGDSKSEMFTPEEAVYNLEDSGLDTNYACTYYPWEQYYDSVNNQYIYLPVTRDVVRNMAYTDNIANPWYASAGYSRGTVSGITPKRKLKKKEQDVLYEGRINFINSFAKEGDRIWGDKNLQAHEGVMDRISKRRLLLHIKNQLSTACIGLIFDPNDAHMANAVRSSVESVLEPIRKSRGLVDYKIVVDDSAEARDRLELPCKIYIKPVQMLEYITFELNVTPNGVSFQ